MQTPRHRVTLITMKGDVMDITQGDSTPAPAEVTNDAPSVTPKIKRARKAASPEVTFSSVIAAYAKSRNIDTTRAGKAIRSKIRAMGDAEVGKAWPAFRKSQKVLRDGNRYPTHMPRDFATRLLGGKSAK